MFLSKTLKLIQSRSSLALGSGASLSFSLRPFRYTATWSPFAQSREPSKEGAPTEGLPGSAAVSPIEYDGFLIAMQKRRRLEIESWGKKEATHKKLKLKKAEPATDYSGVPFYQLQGSHEEILYFEVKALLDQSIHSDEAPTISDTSGLVDSENSSAKQSPLEIQREYDVEIVKLSSTGEGLAYSPSRDRIIVVPFAVPGDVVTAKIYKNLGKYSLADYVKIVRPSNLRGDITPPCKYFSQCGGCQFQMLPYAEQMRHKKAVVDDAFKNFSGLSPDQVPIVLDTMESPLQYGYRTKLTPHFNMPRKPTAESNRSHLNESDEHNIGFNMKGRSRVLDIEQCVIATDILQQGLPVERAETRAKLNKYKHGATLLLRESTTRLPREESTKDGQQSIEPTQYDFDAEPISKKSSTTSAGKPQLTITYPTHIDKKTYATDMSGFTTEYIGPYKFTNRAGSFFQNNNSILRPFTEYIRNQVQPKQAPSQEESEIKYLLDAYCGSGLFTITLSSIFSSALGIDVDVRGIEAARINAEMNNVHNAGFIAADATDLFADIPYPSDKSVVIIDPPRRGASESFLRQLCQFGPKRVIYVSCNVHTQARDVGMIVRGFSDLPHSFRYKIESLKGFDFFPQTGHVEGVCVLSRGDLVGAP